MVTEYPFGLIVICLLLGAGYAFVLYYLDFRRGLKKFIVWAMAALRFISVALISFLLLSPLVKHTEKRLEKPVVVIGVDNSKSLALTADSGYYRKMFPDQIKQLVAALQKKCDVKVYSFSDRLTNGFLADYNGTKTDISLFFDEVNTRYTNRNAAAIILASDGIYNQGSDPFYAAQKIPFPVYTIALGDTNLKKDLAIRKVMVNKTAYKGDRFPVEVLIEMNKFNGLKSNIIISQNSRVVASKEIRSNSDRFMQKVTLMLDAGETGMIRYSVQLKGVEGEATNQNNQSDFMVEVLEARQKIALLTASPHPDITAVQKALEGSSHFEIELFNTDALPRTFDKYDLVVLNQLPSITNVTDLGPLMNSGASLLFIIGSQTDINTFNSLKTGLVIASAKNSFSESQAIINPEFSLFSLEGKDASLFSEFPPLQSPFGSYQVSPLSEVLCYQKIGNIATRTPLIMFTHTPDRKIGIIAGENIWRWRISDFMQQSNHDHFDQWFDKIAQYLSTKEDKSFFRIHAKNRTVENEQVEMEAELFNASYELVNQPDVYITFTDSDNKSYPFICSKTEKAYYLNAGIFPVGGYNYKATVKTASGGYEKTGKLFVEKVNIENSNLTADHNLLFRIASAHEGEMVYKDGIGKLSDKILARQDIRSVAIYQKRLSDLIGNPWLFSLILLLLTAEWGIRKREGL